jgi:hypothetical protein
MGKVGVVHVDWRTWDQMVADVKIVRGAVPVHIRTLDLVTMRRLGIRLGRPALMKRWGCTDWRARAVMLAVKSMESVH